MLLHAEGSPVGAYDQGAHAFSGARGDRLAVSDGDDLRVELRHASQGCPLLSLVEVEGRPTRGEDRVGGDGVAGEEGPPFGLPEGEMSWRVAGRMEHPHGADLLSVL